MMTWSGPLTPHFVSNDSATAELTQSTAHVHHKLPVWSRATLWGTPVKASLGIARTGCVWLCCYMLCLLLWLLCQPGGNNVSAVPAAPHIFFQPLSSHLAYHGFSKQYYTVRYSESVGVVSRISRQSQKLLMFKENQKTVFPKMALQKKQNITLNICNKFKKIIPLAEPATCFREKVAAFLVVLT